MNKLLVVFLGVLSIAATSSSYAASYVVEQKGKAFAPNKLKIKVGDTVEFKNTDPFNHNVFSLSDASTFDLGSYPAGQSKKVVFDKPGKVEVECAIHPEMRLIVEITP